MSGHICLSDAREALLERATRRSCADFFIALQYLLLTPRRGVLTFDCCDNAPIDVASCSLDFAPSYPEGATSELMCVRNFLAADPGKALAMSVYQAKKP
ncbi:hypothetical protein AXG93_4242s1150 [Marchantia polymorpha subsp. ruderalis]|uniref:Uncharacterized protein n=1 Tax=Marchantia polymorpha subsp. ruderalis TaxID=1480154 RepID=A0A176VWR0_MARPO|nr:hypothetical protein AXG93_4242s1150 [Marchantia polymorpha subsp. ruderalis]